MKFKVGDIIRSKAYQNIYTITEVGVNQYSLRDNMNGTGILNEVYENNFEIISSQKIKTGHPLTKIFN